MNALIMKFLLGRGMGVASELLSKAIRHAMGWFGGYLTAAQLASGQDLVTLESAALILGSILLSVIRTFFGKTA